MITRSTAAIILAAALALAGTINPKQDDDRHVEYGSKFHCVARITCEKDGVLQAASCVILSPRVVVTAAHVVKGTENWFVLCDDGSEHRLTGITIHEGFDDDMGFNDIALGVTDEEFSLDFYPEVYTDRDEVGRVVSICGYGLCGTWDTGTVRCDGKKRAGSNTIDSAEKTVLICSVHKHPHTDMEYLIGSGDSGGGLFIGSKLAGVNSFITSTETRPSSRLGEESAHTRVSMFKEWIDSHVTK